MIYNIRPGFGLWGTSTCSRAARRQIRDKRRAPPPMTKAARPAPARAIAHWIIQLSTPVFRAPIHAARVSIGAKPLGCGLGQVLSGRAPFLADVAACRGIVMSDEFWLSIARGAHGRSPGKSMALAGRAICR